VPAIDLGVGVQLVSIPCICCTCMLGDIYGGGAAVPLLYQLSTSCSDTAWLLASGLVAWAQVHRRTGLSGQRAWSPDANLLQGNLPHAE
jgi:hypothetical protein